MNMCVVLIKNHIPAKEKKTKNKKNNKINR